MRVTVTMVTANYQPVEKKGAISENVMVLLLNCKKVRLYVTSKYSGEWFCFDLKIVYF